MPALISLRNEQTPLITRRKCGMTARAAPPQVGVRTLILALGRFEIATKDKARVLEKEWAGCRKHRRMTDEGKVIVELPEICMH